jgi:hypothetical protein
MVNDRVNGSHPNGFHATNGGPSSPKSAHTNRKLHHDAQGTQHGFATNLVHADSEALQGVSTSQSVIPSISLSTTFKQQAPAVHDVRLSFKLLCQLA